MSRIYWDSMLFIYLLEKHANFGPRVRQIEQRIEERGDTLCTSILTIGEVLVGPCSRGKDEGEIEGVRKAIAASAEIIPFDDRAVATYASVRAKLRVRTADAIHLACAAEASTDVFLTNDSGLVGKVVPGIQFIVGLNTDLF